MLAIVHDYDADAAGVLGAEHVVHGSGPDLIGAFVGKLFCHHFGIEGMGRGGIANQLAGLDELKREWEAMTTRVHKLNQKMQERELTYKKQRQQIYKDRKHAQPSDPDQLAEGEGDAHTDPPSAVAPTGSEVSAPGTEVPLAVDQLPPDDASQYTRYTQRFLASFLRVYRESRYLLDRMRHGHEVWVQLHGRISRYTVSLLVHRLQGKPLPMINYKEKRDRDTMTTVHRQRVTDVLVTDEEVGLVQVELTASYPDLRKIFRYYASNECEMGSSMNWKDVSALLNDAKLTGKTQPIAIKGGYESIYHQSTSPVDVHRPPPDDTDPGMEVTASGFIDLLLRIAYHKYRGEGVGGPGGGAPISMGEKLSMLLRHYIVKNCRKLDSDSFRVRYANVDFLDMLRKHKKKMKRVFEVCGGRSGGAGGG